MTQADSTRPGIFWTWQDAQLEDPARIDQELADIASHGFSRALLQPRGCRYGIDDPLFIRRVAQATHAAHALGLGLWLHLDPRSFSRSLIIRTREHAEYLLVAGPGNQASGLPLRERPVDVQCALGEDGRFCIHVDYPTNRPYHVHSDGALTFQPERLERCLAFQQDDAGLVQVQTIHDLTDQARFFTNTIEGYLEVFGRWQPPREGAWQVLAFVILRSNYPDYAGERTRAELCQLLERYAASGAKLDGVWWDEPGYATGFDRRFRADRGRIPFTRSLAALYTARTGRQAQADLLHLLHETDDGRWGQVRNDYYRTLSDAVFGAQEALARTSGELFGPEVGMGAHHTWHQNADDLPHGSMDWWQGSRVLTGGFTDVGSAEEIGHLSKLAETVALAAIAASLGRRAGRTEAYINLWGVAYGRADDAVGPAVMDYWADLLGVLGCRWLAHTYGPTGYFEKPSVWGPGYPQHPTWQRFPAVNERLHRALKLAAGALPDVDVALVYPHDALARLGSDRGNPLAAGVHQVIHAVLEAGYDLDVLAASELAELNAGRYRAVLYLHPFGGRHDDVTNLGRLRRAGSRVFVAGLPPVAGDDFATAAAWTELLGVPVADTPWRQVRESPIQGAWLSSPPAARRWSYGGVSGWGRPAWPLKADGPGQIQVDGQTVGRIGKEVAYLQLLLEGLPGHVPALLREAGLEPSWERPAGALASRTLLDDGSLVIRACPSRYGGSFSGTFRTERGAVSVQSCRGFFGVRLDPAGRPSASYVPDADAWTCERGEVTT